MIPLHAKVAVRKAFLHPMLLVLKDRLLFTSVKVYHGSDRITVPNLIVDSDSASTLIASDAVGDKCEGCRRGGSHQVELRESSGAGAQRNIRVAGDGLHIL